jgi:hypothetical protein
LEARRPISIVATSRIEGLISAIVARRLIFHGLL